MEQIEKVVLRFKSGKILKGYVLDFTAYSDVVIIQEAETLKEHGISIEELKAIFFVKTFEGDSKYRDKKAYGIRNSTGRRVYIRFTDGESMIGFLEGEIPWEKGFYLSKANSNLKGFFLIPVDVDSNNIKVFVVGSSIKDITLMP
jgi:small nuclear ribonucleoprotein (snRNP)-like protein